MPWAPWVSAHQAIIVSLELVSTRFHQYHSSSISSTHGFFSFCLCMRQESLGLQPAMNPVCSHSKALPSLCPQRPYSQRWLYWEALGEHGFWEEFLQFTTDGYSWKEWLCVYCLHCIIVNSRHMPLPQQQAHASSSMSGTLLFLFLRPTGRVFLRYTVEITHILITAHSSSRGVTGSYLPLLWRAIWDLQ